MIQFGALSNTVKQMYLTLLRSVLSIQNTPFQTSGSSLSLL